MATRLNHGIEPFSELIRETPDAVIAAVRAVAGYAPATVAGSYRVVRDDTSDPDAQPESGGPA